MWINFVGLVICIMAGSLAGHFLSYEGIGIVALAQVGMGLWMLPWRN